MLVINGVVYHQGTAQNYFVLTKDGKAEIRSGNEPLQGNEWQATSMFQLLVKDGKNVNTTPDHSTGNRAPRTAIGIKADGNVVLFVVDADETVVGSTDIQLVVPDVISFKSDELSLGFSETTSLGLVVKYKNLDINYSASDFIWKQSDEKMGTFNTDGTYTTNDGLTVSGTVSVEYIGDSSISASLNMIVGKLPVVIWDFEDVTETGGETGEIKVVPAEEYYTIDQKDVDGKWSSLFYTSNYNRGGVQSAEIVSIDDDEPVRMGTHSLKLNYDFRNCGAVTEGALIGTTDAFTVPGAPTAIGVWVYAPEGTGVLWDGDGTTAGLWLRGYYKDSTGSTCQYDFTFEPKSFGSDKSAWPDEYPGIWWEGWHYCEAKLNGNAPYSILPGMTFRLMFVHATKMGEKTAGSIYFDNFQFVYGTNVDDVDSPYVNEMLINYGDNQQMKLTDGVTVPTNKMGFYIDYADIVNKYTSGVDASTTRMYIDGINVNDNEYYNTHTDHDGRNYVYGVTLKNGWHTLTAYAKDNAGNELKETRRFYVDGSDDLSELPTVELICGETAAMLGGHMNLCLNVSNPSQVDAYSVGVKIDSNFTDYTVTFADGYTGTWKYNKLTKVIQYVRSAGQLAIGSYYIYKGNGIVANWTTQQFDENGYWVND